MPVARLTQLAQNPSQATASHRTATVSRLVTASRTRAAAIAQLDGQVNAVYAKFADKTASFSLPQLNKITAALVSARQAVAAERRSALRDLHLSVRANVPNTRIAAQYEDLSAVSAKIAALLVTANASMPESEEPSEHDITTIDANGYVVEDNMQVTPEDDQTVARQAFEDPNAQTVNQQRAGDPNAEPGAVTPANGEVPASAVTGARKADMSSDPNAEPGAPTPANADGVGDGAEYPAQPAAVDSPESAVTATEGNEYPADAELIDTPEGAVTASDDGDEDDVTFGDDHVEPDADDQGGPSDNDGDNAVASEDEGFGAELDLPDSGIDDILQNEILDDGDDAESFLNDADDDTSTQQQVSAAVAARGGQAVRQQRLATARRTDPRASDDLLSRVIGADLMS